MGFLLVPPRAKNDYDKKKKKKRKIIGVNRKLSLCPLYLIWLRVAKGFRKWSRERIVAGGRGGVGIRYREFDRDLRKRTTWSKIIFSGIFASGISGCPFRESRVTHTQSTPPPLSPPPMCREWALNRWSSLPEPHIPSTPPGYGGRGLGGRLSRNRWAHLQTSSVVLPVTHLVSYT